MKPAPIALFTFNRLAHTQRTVEALVRNEFAAQSDLWVFSDGPRTDEDIERVASVRAYLEDLRGFNSVRIVKQSNNLGLARSIIHGVTEVCEHCGRVVVLEDDLVTSPHFLRFVNEALAFYEKDPEVISIHGYVYPIRAALPETFFIRGADCWGWATWQRGWQLFSADGRALLADLEMRRLTHEFDFNNSFGYTAMLRDQIAGKNNSWAIRWYASAFLQHKLTLYPGRSLVQNIGHDSSGMHCVSTTRFDVELASRPVDVRKLQLRENGEARQAFENYFRDLRPSRLRRFWKKLILQV